MRCVKTALFVVVVGIVMGAGSVAWACDVHGRLVCASDQTIGVQGVTVSLTSAADPLTNWVGETVSVPSGTGGYFDTAVSGWGQWYDVNLLTADAYCGSTNPDIQLGTIPVDDPEQCPGTSTCAPVVPEGVTFPYCPAHPIGNPTAECAFFGLSVLDKLDSGGSIATTAAPLALIKAGRCYGIALDVVPGTPLVSPNGQGISHVTYCTCK